MSAPTAAELLDRAVRLLRSSRAIDHWQRDRERIEAEDLLAFSLGEEEPAEDQPVPAPARRRFERLLARRAAGEPVAYLKGFTEFRGLEIRVRPGVFVPRDSSEFLAEQAVRRLRGRRRPVAVDVATGAGPVALAVANEVPGTEVYGTDVSREAVAVARANARRLGLSATFRAGNLFDPLPAGLAARVDVITFHPPYVPRRELRALPLEIRRFEPAHTLTDRSPHGLGLVERAAAEAPRWLRPGGWLLVEVSPDRARAVAVLLRRAGLIEVRSTKDRSFAVTRVVTGRLPGRA